MQIKGGEGIRREDEQGGLEHVEYQRGVFGEGDLSWGYVCSSSVLKDNQSSSLAGLLGDSVHLPRWEPALYELSKTEVLLQIFTVER